LLESIDQTITVLLSQGVLDALYDHLQIFHSIARDQVPDSLDTLLNALVQIFGDRGAETITKAVAKKLFFRLGIEFTDKPSRTLLEYVDQAKMKLKIL